MYFGTIVDGDTIVRMSVDLADLWERAATDGTPVREIVGDDPVDFAENFAESYGGKHWIDKERARLVTTIGRTRGGRPVMAAPRPSHRRSA